MSKRLIIGLIMLAPVLVAAFFGPMLAPYDKYYSEPVRYEETEHGKELIAPPSPPSPDYLIGTDKGGKDIFSLLLYGARWTVGTTLILAAVKVLAGFAFGINAVFRSRHKRLGKIVSAPLNSLPQIVFLYFILARISLNFPFNEFILIAVFGLVAVVFGTPASSAAIEAAGREIAGREFFTAAKAAGAGRFYLVFHHMLPFMKERLLTLFVSEMIAVLNLLGQMGIFGVFLGLTIKTFDPPTLNSGLHEWAGLVGQARFYIYSEQWILLGPLCAYVLFLVSLYFILEGIKTGFRKAYRIS